MMDRTVLSLPVPEQILPDTGNIQLNSMEEPLICISETCRDVMDFEPKYLEQNIPGAIAEVYVRKTVADMLLKATAMLPEGYQFKIYDAWRPAAVQKALFDEYYDRLSKEYEGTGKTEEQLKELTMRFVSFPSSDPAKPFVHSTGGAVDLTIVDAEGRELDMGTGFDDFTDAAHTAYFEHAGSEKIRDNRRLLYNVMRAAGFTNYPSEWWHYDFGDRFWAAMNGRDSIYTGVYENPRNN